MNEKGVAVYAVTPQSVANNSELVRKLRLNFEILHDPANSFAEKLDLVHGFPDDLKDVYLQFGADLNEVNGEDSWTLPIPTQIVAGGDSVIRSISYNADYKVRPEPEELLEQF